MNREQAGELIGKYFGRNVFELYLYEMDIHRITVHGAEKIGKLPSRHPSIIVANHTIPAKLPRKTGQISGKVRSSGPTPDALILINMFREYSDRGLVPLALANNDAIKEVAGPYIGFDRAKGVQDSLQPWRMGFVRGFGGIPVDKSKGAINRQLKEEIHKSIMTRNEHLLIFPEKDYRQSGWNYVENGMPLDPGVSWIAKKYGLPVLPIYIGGCPEKIDWRGNNSAEIHVMVGDPIDTLGLRKSEINERIANAIIGLQEEYFGLGGEPPVV